MSDAKDLEQDAMIRRNAENIERNQAAILRQTECLEQIRAHYYPKKSAWKTCVGLFLKLVGALTVIAGLQEGVLWLWDSHKTQAMARHCANVAQRLLFEESDLQGALSFVQKASELAGDDTEYRSRFIYMKGMLAVSDLFGLGRPLTKAERARVDAILSEAKYLQEVASEDPVSFVLEAQARLLREETEMALRAIGEAVRLQPSNAYVRTTSCAVRFAMKDPLAARREIEIAARINPKLPMVRYWQGFLSTLVERDFAAAEAKFAEMVADTPQLYLGHLMLGWVKLNAPAPDLDAAYKEYEAAYDLRPDRLETLIGLAECCERRKELVKAQIWLEKALAQEGNCMEALLAHARVCAAQGDLAPAGRDLDAAIALSPFDASLYRKRAELRKQSGEPGAAEDLKRYEALSK